MKIKPGLRPMSTTPLRRGVFSRTGKIGPAQRVKLDLIDTASHLLPAKFERQHEWLNIRRRSVINLGHDIRALKKKHKQAVANGEVPKTQLEVTTLLNHLDALLSISQELVLEPNLEKIFTSILKGVKELGFKRGFLYTYDGKSKLLQLKSAIDMEEARDSRYHEPTDPHEAGDTPKSQAIDSRDIVIVSKRIENRPPEIVLPLFVENEVAGILKVDNNDSMPLFKAGVSRKITTTILTTFANLAGASIRNALQFKELEDTKYRFSEAVNLARMGEMAALVGHNLMNPLAVITGIIQTVMIEHAKITRMIDRQLAEVGGEELIPEKMKSIMMAWTEQLIRNFEYKSTEIILAAERISEVRKLLEPFHTPAAKSQPTKLNEILKSAMALSEILASKNGTTIELRLNEEEISVQSSGKLELAVFAVLKNAIESLQAKSEQGQDDFHGKITIRSYVSGKRVVLEIEDNGVGIENDHIGRIFDPFFSKNKDLTSNHGLGLSFAREIIKKSWGSIRVSSIFGDGATVRIELNPAD